MGYKQMLDMARAESRSWQVELVTFYLRDAQYGINILEVQEINKLQAWTPVPHSEAFVLGILSLRGNIVTIIDLARKLGLDKTQVGRDSRIIIVKLEEECVGFLVDMIGNVTTVNWEQVCQAPANVNGVGGRFLEGVLKTDKRLIALLNTKEVLTDVVLKPQAPQAGQDGRI